MPKQKSHNEFVKQIYDIVKNEYSVLGNYVNAETKILVRHNCDDCNNNEWEVLPNLFLGNKDRTGTRCPICHYNKPPYNKLKYDEVKNFIENESQSNCILLTLESDYIDTQHKIKIRCKCGNEYETKFIEFKSRNKRQCNACGFKIRGNNIRLSYKVVKEKIERVEGYKLISDIYINSHDKLKIMCNKGHVFERNFNDFSENHTSCPYCAFENGAKNNPFTYEEVKQILNADNYEMISSEYINTKSKIQIKCDKGHIYEACFGDFRIGNRCPVCYEERKFNPYSTLNIYLRSKINNWKLDTVKNCNYRCVVSNKPFDDIHHLYSFNEIVKETLETLKYPIYSELGEYSGKQLLLIEKVCLELHYKYGLGVCLTRDIHKAFHRIYGIKDNTPEQFNQFVQGIKNNKITLIMEDF